MRAWRAASAKPRPREQGAVHPRRTQPRLEVRAGGLRRLPGAQARGPGLLARAVVAVERADLDCLVDGLDQLAVFLGRLRVVAGGDGGLEAAEVGLDRRRVAAGLETLALGTKDALLLRVDIGHLRRGSVATVGRPTAAVASAAGVGRGLHPER